jgi:hypothetical protein
VLRGGHALGQGLELFVGPIDQPEPFEPAVDGGAAISESCATGSSTAAARKACARAVKRRLMVADAGVHTFTNGVSLRTAGSQKVTAADAANGINGTATVVVTAAPADHFVLTAPAEVTAGLPFDLTLTALDPYGNTDTNYQGTVHFSTSPAQQAGTCSRPAASPRGQCPNTLSLADSRWSRRGCRP